MAMVGGCVGECGGAGYEGRVGGGQKRVVRKGVGSDGSKIDSNRSYPLDHVLPGDTPNIIQSQGRSKDAILESLRKLGLLNS